MTVTIKGTNLDLTPALKRYATAKVLGVLKFLPTVTIARLELERTTQHHRKGAVWRAEANLRAPHRLVRAEAFGYDIYAAIDGLRDELTHELKVVKGKRQAEVRRARRAKERER
jgi:putative sigma-54 modulation protein